ncbi:response regulator [Rhizobium sp.]|uniref:response regulator n=1 Tax=Rhizobium sp. TaxID=391 RepID=UPI0028A1E646
MALIVIAEDEFLIQDVLAMMLEDAGYDVEAASHGAAALELVKQHKPALVVTDFMMPLMTGLELARAMRANAELKTIPIILTSGAQGSIGRAEPEMFDAVLDKPYREKELLVTIGNLLGGAS